jgi:hypothetical protein
MSLGILLPIARRALLPMVLAAMTISFFGSASTASANDIFYWGTQPGGKPAFGQTVMVTGIVSRDDGGRVANVPLQLWFSGRHGVRAGTYTTRTDRLGRYSVLMTIPRYWANGIQGDRTWVDVTVASPSIGVSRLFRVRNK